MRKNNRLIKIDEDMWCKLKEFQSDFEKAMGIEVPLKKFLAVKNWEELVIKKKKPIN